MYRNMHIYTCGMKGSHRTSPGGVRGFLVPHLYPLAALFGPGSVLASRAKPRHRARTVGKCAGPILTSTSEMSTATVAQSMVYLCTVYVYTYVCVHIYIHVQKDVMCIYIYIHI